MKPKKPRPTDPTIARRVDEILRIRLDGAEFWDVREYVREKEKEAGSAWEVKPDGKPLTHSTIWRYIRRTNLLISQSCGASRDKLIQRHLAKRRNVYAKAIGQGDLRTALATLVDETKLLGLYPRDDAEALAEIAKLKDEIRGLRATQEGDGGVAGGSGDVQIESDADA